MTDDLPTEADDASSASRSGTGAPFLTVVARAPLALADEPPQPLRELLACTRRLLLCPTGPDATAPVGGDGDGDGLRAHLGPQAVLVLLPPEPAGSDPAAVFERALDRSGCRRDPLGARGALLVTESLEAWAPHPAEPGRLERLCDLRTDDFTTAWNGHLARLAAEGHLAPVPEVVPGPDAVASLAGSPTVDAPEAGAPGPDARRVEELERTIRELAHERQVLRENRDHTVEEYRAELRAHRELHGSVRDELEASQRELELRAEHLAATSAEWNEHRERMEAELTACYRELELRGGRIEELEHTVRELAHERQVLRENRDHTVAEHREELRIHRELQERLGQELEASQRELDLRAERLDAWWAEWTEQRERMEGELEACYRELELRAGLLDGQRAELGRLEGLVRRTGAARIARWLDRLGALRGRRAGGAPAEPSEPPGAP